MKPIKKKILFRPFPGAETTEGGLLIPESVRKLSNKGEVVEVGSEVTKVKKGDIGYRVKDWSDSDFIINGETHCIMDESAILAII